MNPRHLCVFVLLMASTMTLVASKTAEKCNTCTSPCQTLAYGNKTDSANLPLSNHASSTPEQAAIAYVTTATGSAVNTTPHRRTHNNGSRVLLRHKDDTRHQLHIQGRAALPELLAAHRRARRTPLADADVPASAVQPRMVPPTAPTPQRPADDRAALPLSSPAGNCIADGAPDTNDRPPSRDKGRVTAQPCNTGEPHPAQPRAVQSASPTH